MITKMRGDRRVHAERIECELLTLEECKALKGGNHVHILDSNKHIARVLITSVKTYKKSAIIEIRCKFGLYEFFRIHIADNMPNIDFVKVVPQKEPSYW